MEWHRWRGQVWLASVGVTLLLASSLLGAPPAAAKNAHEDLIHFAVTVKPQSVRRGQTITVTIKGTPSPGFHTYPITQRTPDEDELNLMRLSFSKTAGIQPVPGVTEGPTQFEDGLTPDLKTAPFAVFEKPFQWSQDILITPDAPPGKLTFQVKLDGQVCDEHHCVPLQRTFTQTVDVGNEPTLAVAPEIQQRIKAGAPPIKVVTPPKSASASTDAAPASDLWSFIVAGVFWGAISLITPCVFPMIPITVSFFLHQSEKQHYRPVTMALVYCATIIVVLTAAAIAFLSFFQWLSTNWIMNIFLGGLFIFFALSLFGMYEIELPSSLARFTSAREGKGGLLGTMFMALTFTIISFACVAPFLGGFGGTAAATELGWVQRVLGGVAFSATFAAPFFLLALFPRMLKAMPKSGSWLNTVKVVMGFLELAAALAFLRTAEVAIRPHAVFFTYDLVLGSYIALAVLCGLYLLGVYRLPHDTPEEHLSVPRLLFSAGFLALALYLTPALFRYSANGENQRPDGEVFAWLDAFLLPNEAKGDLPWTADLNKALAQARAQGKLVFVDFTGVTCKNCQLNERDVFPQPEIKKLLVKYELVKLYLDRVPNEFYSPDQLAKFGGTVQQQLKDAQANLELENNVFDSTQRPLYAVLEPTSDGSFHIRAKYEEGKISSAAKFAQFLSQPLSATGPIAQATKP